MLPAAALKDEAIFPSLRPFARPLSLWYCSSDRTFNAPWPERVFESKHVNLATSFSRSCAHFTLDPVLWARRGSTLDSAALFPVPLSLPRWQRKLRSLHSPSPRICRSSSDPATIPAAMNYARDPAADYPHQYAILITLLKWPLNSSECAWKDAGTRVALRRRELFLCIFYLYPSRRDLGETLKTSQKSHGAFSFLGIMAR